jgi:hypothetical protein
MANIPLAMFGRGYGRPAKIPAAFSVERFGAPA